MIKLKEELRKEIIKKRISMSDKDVSEKSIIITDTILKLKEYKNSLDIMCYVDYKKEVSTKMLINQAIYDKKRLSVPYITNTDIYNATMIAARIRDFNTDLEIGEYGILAPRKDDLKPVEPGGIDCVIVPGVAFDIKKNRIGYGAGYYDRFLCLLKPDCLKIGIAFEIQLIDEIKKDPHDIQLDIIITEERIII